MHARYLMLAVAAILMTPTGASTQEINGIITPTPPEGERATPLVSQTLDSSRGTVQRAVDEMKTHIDDLLSEPLGPDVDRSLSEEVMSFQNLEIELAELTMTYATDPELRRMAKNNIDAFVAQLATMREWQMSRRAHPQPTTPPAASSPDAKP
jgi:hypothetical protein